MRAEPSTRAEPPVRASARVPAGMRLAIVGALAASAVAVFLFTGVEGSWEFALSFRGRKVLAMLVVAAAIAISTVLFQTVTNNRILTPSIMGFDALYLLIQTAVVAGFGASALAGLDGRVKWAVEVAVMVAFSALLFRWLFAGARRSIHLLVLVGIVFGILFRSVSTFLQRMLDPAEYAVLQDAFFASFNAVDEELLVLAAGVVLVAGAVAARFTGVFDVLSLGPAHAIGLGVDHRRVVTGVLVLVAVLVSVSTALVGPITFFGLIVANLASLLLGTSRHAYTLPTAVLLGVLCLVGGQFVLERLLGFDSALNVVIEFAGGLVFILYLVRRGVR